MSFTLTHSTSPGDVRDGGQIFYVLKEALKAQGWTHVASGDGLALFSTGSDQITNGDSGANGFDNTRAWITLQQPSGGSGAYAGTRQITLQIGDGAGASLGSTARIVYSPGGTAVTGACDANTVPTFSDEVILVGGGTPAAPTFASFCPGGIVGAVDKMHVVVGDASENFGFWTTIRNNSQPTFNGFTFIFDPIVEPLTGDDDPFVITAYTSSNGLPIFNLSSLNANPDTAPIWAKFAAGGVQRTSMESHSALATVTNSRNIRDDLFPLMYVRHTTNGGYKGYSSLMRSIGTSRAEASLFSVDATGDRVKFGTTDTCRIVLKSWDNTVP